MSIEKIIASIPGKSEAERRIMRKNAEDLLANGTPVQKADAASLIAALDAQQAAEHRTLYDRIKGQTVAERVVGAFQSMLPTATDKKVILALFENPNATSTELSKACGWRGMIWHTHFGMMCKDREAWLWPAEPSDTRDANFYCGILADFDRSGSLFTLKPDATKGFAALGIVPEGPSNGSEQTAA